jgi:hypothetical protein
MPWRQHKGEHLMLETSARKENEEVEVEEAVAEDVVRRMLVESGCQIGSQRKY